jgi:hypothetical protein
MALVTAQVAFWPTGPVISLPTRSTIDEEEGAEELGNSCASLFWATTLASELGNEKELVLTKMDDRFPTANMHTRVIASQNPR